MKSSLIVLTYNELGEGTIPCVESIYKYTNPEDFELIIIDNNSKDGTPEYLKELKEKYNNVKIQLNKKNKGFAAGINDGLKLAAGDFLFILNNDILVTPGWLDKLVASLKNNPEIGLIGPITNSAGNEQCVYFEGLDKKNYIDLTTEFTESQKGEMYYTKRLAFFCTGMRRDVFEQIGLLDENFVIGWYEDDDYCLRVLEAGYKIAIADGCFIYHHGSLSFSKANVKLAEKNQKYFLKKHNCDWTVASGTLSYLKKISTDLNKYVQANSQIDKNIARVLVRLETFEKYLKWINEDEAIRRRKARMTLFQKFKWLISYPERSIRNKIKNFYSIKLKEK